MSILRVITIRGLAFRGDEEYFCAYKPDNQELQLQFTKAEVENSETLKWIFRVVHTAEIISCGQIILRDSKGNQYQAQSPRNIADSQLCYLNDMKIDSLSLASFPFNMDPVGYQTDLSMHKETLDLLSANQIMR